MRRRAALALLFVLCTCCPAFSAEKIELGKDLIRVGVVFASDNFNIPDDLAKLVTGIFGGALAQTNLVKVVGLQQIDMARERLGLPQSQLTDTLALCKVGHEADVHFIVLTKISYDLEKAAKTESAVGLAKLWKFNASPFAKREKPEFDISVVDCSTAKIVFNNKLKLNLFSSDMKHKLAAGLLSGKSLDLGSDALNLDPLVKLAKKLAPLMEQAMTEAALLEIQHEAKDYEGMTKTAVELLHGQPHDKDDIKDAAFKAVSENEEVRKLANSASSRLGKTNSKLTETANKLNESSVNNSSSESAGGDDSISNSASVVNDIEIQPDKVVVIGVMPFMSSNNISQDTAAFAGDVFTKTLGLSGNASITGREVLTEIANENNLVLSDQTALEAGKLAGCNFIITGSLNALEARSKKKGVYASAEIHVIDTETGQETASISESVQTAKKASISTSPVSSVEAGAISELASRLSIGVMGLLTGEVPHVTKTYGKQIELNLGSGAGVKKNDLYRVYLVEDGQEKNIAIVKVSRTTSNSSTAKSAGKKLGKLALVHPGDKVAPISSSELKVLPKKGGFISVRE